MAEEHVKNTKYKYTLNASLVQQQKHTATESGIGDGTGQSLVGRLTNVQFGDKVAYSKPEELQEKALKKLKQGKSKVSGQGQATGDVLNVKISQDELLYRPKTQETRAVYEQMLAIVCRIMGDQPLEMVKGALDEIIALLKTDIKDSERRSEIEGMVDKISDTDFNSLTVLCQYLVDYTVEQKTDQQKQTVEEVQVDPEMNFSNSEESDFEDVYQVKDIRDVEPKEEAVDEEQAEEQAAPAEASVMLSLSEIDAQWLSKHLKEAFGETRSADEMAKAELVILDLLGNEGINQRDCEKKLLQIIGHKKFTFVRQLMKHRPSIYYGTLLSQAQTKSQRDEIVARMQKSELAKGLLNTNTQQRSSLLKEKKDQVIQEGNWQATNAQIEKNAPWLNQKVAQVDFEKLKFQEAGRLMVNKKCHLPKGSTKTQKQGYDEISLPATRHQLKPDEKLIPIPSLPPWTHKAFPKEMTSLNVIQSRLYESAFKTPENLLVCAPTGAGKTNIALLTILQCLDKRRRSNNSIDVKSFKIVYIAPMKALVSEVVGNFQKRLVDYGITVRELTGDTHLTRQQIDETQIIVTTPEKWDIITRKSGDRAYVELVKLIIIDEVHLLHDSRGPVLEAIIARTIRQIEQTSELVRIVALSATLPNYMDVAAFLRVKKKNVFYFDNSYRPVPLEQIYIGVNEKKAIKRLILMNEILYEKVIERAGKHQMIVFVHSRKEAAKTAKVVRDIALQQDQLSKFLKEDSASKELLLAQVELCQSQDLKDVLPFGIGMHHAGMTKSDRKMVEDLFAAGYIQLLCSTATLAWGVNLPAHTVIIKGTQIYSPEKGRWIELSPQDMLQMMGRAGRPQYDTVGEGIILTNQSEMQYYLSLNNMQLPIESQMMSQLADHMCAEVVLGTISNIKEAVNWLAYTYLYVRMLRSPELYGVDISQNLNDDPTLVQRRQELVYSAAMLLQRSHMLKFDKATGGLQSTALGKIAAHYYIQCESMQIYAENMKPHMSTIDLFRLFSLSKEFQFIPIRETEKAELVKFIERVPIPVKGGLDESATKINVLLQAHISRFKMDGYDINSDTVYVSQNAGRIMRALFEIALRKGWAAVSEQLLNLCKVCEKRIWNSMTPLRQFTKMPNLDDIVRKLEKKAQFQWQHFYEMTPQQLGEVVGMPKMGHKLQSYINRFPRIELEAYVQPLTRTILRIELDLKVHENFTWDQQYHGTAEPFWILIHDSDNELILHAEQFILKEANCHDDHRLNFTVGLHEPMPPQYFVKIISDRWMHAETSLPISFKHLLLPERFPAPTQLQDMYPRSIKDLHFEDGEAMYEKDGLKEFNSVQTQVFEKVYETRDSIFLGAPSSTNTMTIAELAIFKELQDEDPGKVLYIAPNQLACLSVAQNWRARLTKHLDLQIALLDETQTFSVQAQQMQSADVVITTPKVWESISRRWRQRKVVQQVTLCIFECLQLLSPEYEVVCSRTRLIQNELKDTVVQGRQTAKKIRIIGLACPIANGKDVASWLGVSTNAENGGYFNFLPSVRPIQIEASILPYDQFNRTTRLLAMAKPCYNQARKNTGKSLIFVADRKQTRLTGLDFLQFTATEENPKQFLSDDAVDRKVMERLSEKTLISCLEYGIGLIHDGMTDREIQTVKQLFKAGVIKVLIASHQYCWDLTIQDAASELVVVMNAEKWCGQERRHIEYDIPSVLQMQSLAAVKPEQGQPKFLLQVYSPHKDYFIKFLQEPLPLESQLVDNLHDFLNTEIVAGTVSTKQEAVDWLTWTFLFRRLAPNPNHYNLSGRAPQDINNFISQLIEDTVEDLVQAKCICVDEETELDLSPGNFGRIAAFYGVQYQTIGLFAKHFDDSVELKQSQKVLMQVLSQASEFRNLPIRDGDEALLSTIASHLTYRPQDTQQDLNTPALKTSILLQSHFDRRPLPIDLNLDQKYILKEVLRLCHAMTDVISTNGHLQATLQSMELSQMCVQALWPKQSPLLQLPGFDQELVDELKKAEVNDITDFMNMDDELRDKIMQVNDDEMEKLAQVCNRYPVVEMSYELQKEWFEAEEAVIVDVTVARADADDEESLAVFEQPIHAQYFPTKRHEEWWLVVGHVKSGKLLSIKKITNFKSAQTPRVQAQLKFQVPGGGDYLKDEFSYSELRLYLICDSYVGADLQEDMKVKLKC